MKIILCLDDRNGFRFNHRRQSRDRRLTERLCEITAGAPLYFSPCSACLFPEGRGIAAENPLDAAGEGAYCFLEALLPDFSDSRIEEILLCRWNRVYPADTYAVLPETWQVAGEEAFAGSSHEKITIQYLEKR